MSAHFAQGVYAFCAGDKGIFELILEEFDGKVVGSEDFNLEKLKEKFFEGYTPGDKVKVKPEKKEKKPRAMNGYTYFGNQNKEKFNEEMNAMEEKPKFVSYVGEKWKVLSKEDKDEWKEKAKKAFEDSQTN
jgi:hypothetical protein